MAKAKETSRPSKLSQERVGDSSDEDAPPSAQQKALKSKKSAVKGSSDSKSLNKKTKQKSPTPEAVASSSSDEEESDESEASETGEDATDESDDNPAATSTSSRKRPSPVPQHTPSKKRVKTNTTAAVKIPAVPYKAPKGFEPVTLSVSDYASDMSLFGDLSDKQIWHIAVPDTISIDTIKELDIEAVLKGQPILSKHGVEYNMHSLPTRKEVIFLPHGPEANYKASERVIDRSFHMREVSIRTERQEETPVVFTATQTGKPKEIRKQPEGLRMRYVPYGAPAVQTSPEDVEMSDTFEVPADVDVTSSSPARSKVPKQTNGNEGHEKISGKKQRSSGDHASPGKKKQKKRRLVDEEAE